MGNEIFSVEEQNNQNNNLIQKNIYNETPKIKLNDKIFNTNKDCHYSLSNIMEEYIKIPIFETKNYKCLKPEEILLSKENIIDIKNKNLTTTNQNEKKHIKEKKSYGLNSTLNTTTSVVDIDSPEFNYMQEEIKYNSEAGSLFKDIREIYKFKDLLGSGHFGTVRTAYRRYEKPPHKLYAVKSISKKHLSEKDLKDLTREVDIISSLDHPNVIKFYETYHDQFYFHIVTELCRGKDLLGKLLENNGRLSEKKCAIIIMKILHAISYCHSRGITHRDLKPENIIFESKDEDSELKLIDFGLSRKYFMNEKMHTILGTPYYVAPDVLKGNYDEKCDIWSIGTITYLLLCGEPPFKGNSNNEIFKKILYNEINFSNYGWRGVSEDAKNFIKYCCIKEPNKRPTAQEALSHKWFNCLLSTVHSNEFIDKNILENLKKFKPMHKFTKLVMKYLINTLGHKELKPYKRAFYAFDFSHSGSINVDEIKKGFKLDGEEISDEKIKNIMYASDDPNRQSLDYSEFILCCLDLKKIVNKDKIDNAFHYFDVDNNGVIDVNDLKTCMLRFGKKVVEDECIAQTIIKFTNNSNLIEINYKQFLEIFKEIINVNDFIIN